MKYALVVAVTLVIACEKKQAAPAVPEPDKELVQAMMDYCRISDLPRDKWREAQRAWGFQNGGNQKIMPIWNKAARDKDPDAIKVVRRAADLALGEGKCPILNVLDRKDQVPAEWKQQLPEDGSAAAPENGSATP